MVMYTYSIYIFDMNMRSGCYSLLHVGKSEKNGVLRVLQILHVRVKTNMKNQVLADLSIQHFESYQLD